jgi:hypothetical protein
VVNEKKKKQTKCEVKMNRKKKPNERMSLRFDTSAYGLNFGKMDKYNEGFM